MVRRRLPDDRVVGPKGVGGVAVGSFGVPLPVGRKLIENVSRSGLGIGIGLRQLLINSQTAIIGQIQRQLGPILGNPDMRRDLI